MPNHQHDGRNTDEEIDEILNSWHRAEEHIHDIPVAIQEVAETHEAPVESTDHDESECNTM